MCLHVYSLSKDLGAVLSEINFLVVIHIQRPSCENQMKQVYFKIIFCLVTQILFYWCCREKDLEAKFIIQMEKSKTTITNLKVSGEWSLLQFWPHTHPLPLWCRQMKHLGFLHLWVHGANSVQWTVSVCSLLRLSPEPKQGSEPSASSTLLSPDWKVRPKLSKTKIWHFYPVSPEPEPEPESCLYPVKYWTSFDPRFICFETGFQVA